MTINFQAIHDFLELQEYDKQINQNQKQFLNFFESFNKSHLYKNCITHSEVFFSTCYFEIFQSVLLKKKSDETGCFKLVTFILIIAQ